LAELKVACLLVQQDGQVLNLSLLPGDSLYEFPLLIKVSVANQLGVVHFDQLQLLSGSELLLDEVLTLTSMGLFDFIYLK